MKRFFIVVAVCAVALFAAGVPAFAHGHRDTQGLQLTVGWADEPAVVGQLNAVQLIVQDEGAPVEGAAASLRVVVSIGDETSDPLELSPVAGRPGEYRAVIIPTVVGGYTFHFTGNIEHDRIDESFTAPKDDFDEVQGASDIAFPKQAPTTTELAEKLASVERKAADADAAARRARFIGFFGVLIAIAGIGLGFFSRRRA